MEAKKNKYIAKTVGTTVAFLIIILITLIGFMSLFFPKTMGTFTAKLGMKQLSCNFARSQYNKTSDINDLSVVIDRSIDAKNYDFVLTYTDKMIKGEHFDEYASFVNKASVTAKDYKSYIFGYYAIALYKTGNKTEAVSFAIEKATGKYSDTNALRYLLNYLSDDDSQKKVLDFFESEVAQKETLINSATEQTEINKLKSEARRICVDGYSLAVLADNNEKMNFWEDKFKAFQVAG